MKVRRLSFLILSVLLAIGLLLTGCVPKPKEAVGPPIKTGGVLNDYFTEDPGTFDVQADTTLAVYGLAWELYNTLVRYTGQTLVLQPELLTKMPEISSDGLVYTFELRKGVHFTDPDKTELTASDVKFTIERMLGPVGLSKWVFEPIKGAKEFIEGKASSVSGIEIIDKYHFKITLEKPYSPFLQNLAVPCASIYSEKLVKAAGDDWKHNPIGTGPFKLKSYIPNTEIVLEKNPDYFEEGLPYLDGIRYRIVPESTTALMEFESGTLDLSGIPTEEFDRIVGSGKYQIHESTPLNTYYFVFNMKAPVWQDVRLRKALAMAIDKQAIIDSILGGRAQVATAFVTPGIPGAFELGKGPAYPYNPEEAKKLVEEATGGKPIEAEAWQRGGTQVADVNIAIQEFARNIGIDLKVTIQERAVFGQARAEGKVPANYGNWWTDIPDPDNYLYTYFHPTNLMSTGYDNPTVTEILEQAKVEIDPQKRAELYQKAETIIIKDDCAIIPLFHRTRYLAVQKNVHGIIAHPTGVNSYKHTWKEAATK